MTTAREGDDLARLEAQIDGYEYRYYGGGWLKATRLSALLSATAPGVDARFGEVHQNLTALLAGAVVEPQALLRIVAAYLWHELPLEIPEHARWNDLVGADWHVADEQGARQIAAEIEQATTDWDARNGSDDDGPTVDVLRRLFFDDLFGGGGATYFSQRAPAGAPPVDVGALIEMTLNDDARLFAGGPVRTPAVVGIDLRMIAVFWFN
ncbi:MAG: hypothetical protein ABI867_37425 [Kofleriaceae bacterium]